MDHVDLSILRAIRDTDAERRVPVVSLEEAFPHARVEERLPGLWNRGLLVVYGYHRTEQWSVYITVDGLRALAAEEQLVEREAAKHAEEVAKEETRKAERAEDVRWRKKSLLLGLVIGFISGVATTVLGVWLSHIW